MEVNFGQFEIWIILFSTAKQVYQICHFQIPLMDNLIKRGIKINNTLTPTASQTLYACITIMAVIQIMCTNLTGLVVPSTFFPLPPC